MEQKAIVQLPGGGFGVKCVILRKLLAGEVLIKTVAVALNPTDYKSPKRFPSPGAIAGCDFAGTVVALGDATRRDEQPLCLGDRVCGPIHGSNPTDHTSGAFSQYIYTTVDLVLKIPDSVSWEEGAAIGGTGHGSLCLALWEYLNIPGRPEAPAAEPEMILVYACSVL